MTADRRCEGCGYDGEAGHCHLCHDTHGGGAMGGLDHMRVVHPDVYEAIERWPDGGIIIHDRTLEPGDFT